MFFYKILQSISKHEVSFQRVKCKCIVLWCTQVFVQREQGHRKSCPIICNEIIKIFIKIAQYSSTFKFCSIEKVLSGITIMQPLATTALSSTKLSTTNYLTVGLGGIVLVCGHLEVLILCHWSFCFWGYTKNRGNLEIIRDQEHRRGKELTQHFQLLTSEMFQNTQREVDYGQVSLYRTTGEHTLQYLCHKKCIIVSAL